jgi:hypothetical protein
MPAVLGLTRGRVAVPASINNPVVGTSLLSVWNLQYGGTGPRAAYTNGTWAGSVDAYLTGKGFSISNGFLYINVTTSNVTINNYDFRGCPSIALNGTSGSVTFVDCVFDLGVAANQYASPIAAPANASGTIDYNAGTLTVTFSYCLLDKATFFQGSGTTTFSYCRIRNQYQGLSAVGYNGLGYSSMTYDSCYITGGGVKPTYDAHVELLVIQRNAAMTTSVCSVTNCMVDISQDGQIGATNWNSAWTGVWFNTAAAMTFSNNIIIGLSRVNACPINPNVVNNVYAYSQTGSSCTLTNNVMEAGSNGYTVNQNAGAARPTDGGGNRSYANAALTVANFN